MGVSGRTCVLAGGHMGPPLQLSIVTVGAHPCVRPSSINIPFTCLKAGAPLKGKIPAGEIPAGGKYLRGETYIKIKKENEKNGNRRN